MIDSLDEYAGLPHLYKNAAAIWRLHTEDNGQGLDKFHNGDDLAV